MYGRWGMFEICCDLNIKEIALYRQNQDTGTKTSNSGMMISLTLSIVATTLEVSVVYASHHLLQKEIHCKWPFSKLYIYTNPVQSECMVLRHAGKVMTPWRN
jgi:hypothetical protein